MRRHQLTALTARRRFQRFGALCLVSATNIINRGTIEVGPNGLLSLQGQNINLFGGLLNMEGFESGDQSGRAGMFDGYWGMGPTPEYNPVASFRPTSAISPAHWVTNRDYTSMETVLALTRVTTYMNSITNAISKITIEGEEGGMHYRVGDRPVGPDSLSAKWGRCEHTATSIFPA